jgi:hypothetical protein
MTDILAGLISLAMHVADQPCMVREGAEHPGVLQSLPASRDLECGHACPLVGLRLEHLLQLRGHLLSLIAGQAVDDPALNTVPGPV